MKLLNTKSRRIEEFLGQNIPPYAILSHTWEEEEVSFKDLSDPFCKNKKGHHKIQMACNLAYQNRLGYIWIDTCCIDKSSSAELSESINSMFRWYERSNACFVYLSDLSATSSLESQLPYCRWFTRGWTLQELIAPTNLMFFDRNWNYRKSKNELIPELAEITGIDDQILRKTRLLSSIAVSQRMSWAARRETSRIEDMAYCLLGIFGVHIPMIYGEEEQAFQRLQEEIMKQNFDISILAWTMVPDTKQDPKARFLTGVLAKSPLDFASCGSTFQLPSYARTDFSISNRGLKIHAKLAIERLIPEKARREPRRYVFPVCSSKSGGLLGIRLRKFDFDLFLREDPYALVEIGYNFGRTLLRTMYFLTWIPALDAPIGSMIPHCMICQRRSNVLRIDLPSTFAVDNSWPYGGFDNEDSVFFMTKDSGLDWSSMNLRAYFSGFINDCKYQFPVECTLYAWGWADLETQLQCTIIDHTLFRSSVIELNTRHAELDGDSLRFQRKLRQFGIPISKSVVFKFPEIKAHATISLTAKIMKDPNICESAFWQIEIKSQSFFDIGGGAGVPDVKREIKAMKFTSPPYLRGAESFSHLPIM